MIRFFDESDLTAYRESGDPVLRYLPRPGIPDTAGDRLLRDSEVKRMLAWAVYGPLLQAKRRLRITDIGGGSSALVRAVARRHDYMLVDLVGEAPEGVPVSEGDWCDLGPTVTDLIVSVDVFPNVDQRLAAFLQWCSGIPFRLLLTTYEDRWYRARRDEGELLTVRAWDWAQTAATLHVDAQPPAGSLFPNGRQVCLVTT